MIKGEKEEGPLLHTSISPTAASLNDRKFPDSGSMTYRVTIAGGMGLQAVDVEAATGDEAANAAIARHPGCKVAHVEPAPQKAKAA